MREYINIVESLLKEYITAPGSDPRELLDLNVFQDMLNPYPEDAGGVRDVLSVQQFQEYKNKANEVRGEIEKLEFPLLPEMSEEVNLIFYDGTSTYEYADTLLKLYDEQLNLCKKIIVELQELIKLPPNKFKNAILRSIMADIKSRTADHILTGHYIGEIKEFIQKLRQRGFDYPEFATIERHLDNI